MSHSMARWGCAMAAGLALGLAGPAGAEAGASDAAAGVSGAVAWASGAGAADTLGVAAAPIGYEFPTPREQFRDWALNAAGPAAIAGNLVGASWRTWVTEEPVEWGDSGRDFWKRFGTGSLTTAIGETSLSLASALMRQDPNYYRSPRSGFGPRLRHALKMTFMARDPDGRAVFSPAKTLSPFVGPVVVHTTLYPGEHQVVDGLVSGLYGLGINAAWNAGREFVVGAKTW